jgi:hypothetical protein
VLSELVWILDLVLWDPGELAWIHGKIRKDPSCQLGHILRSSHTPMTGFKKLTFNFETLKFLSFLTQMRL